MLPPDERRVPWAEEMTGVTTRFGTASPEQIALHIKGMRLRRLRERIPGKEEGTSKAKGWH